MSSYAPTPLSQPKLVTLATAPTQPQQAGSVPGPCCPLQTSYSSLSGGFFFSASQQWRTPRPSGRIRHGSGSPTRWRPQLPESSQREESLLEAIDIVAKGKRISVNLNLHYVFTFCFRVLTSQSVVDPSKKSKGQSREKFYFLQLECISEMAKQRPLLSLQRQVSKKPQTPGDWWAEEKKKKSRWEPEVFYGSWTEKENKEASLADHRSSTG